jgi:hypothetical protein
MGVRNGHGLQRHSMTASITPSNQYETGGARIMMHVPGRQRPSMLQDALVEVHEPRRPRRLQLLAARRRVLRRRRRRQEASKQPRRLQIGRGLGFG